MKQNSDLTGYVPPKKLEVNTETFEDNIIYKDEICSNFGCGQILSLTERLYGTKCTNHQGCNTEIIGKMIMSKDTVLLKLKRDFTESEAISQLLKIVSEKEIEIGMLKGELSEAKYKLTQPQKTKKEWLKDELIAHLESQASHDRDLYKKAMESTNEWRNKYFSLIFKK